jgi:ADP-ribose pyrophosphatase YjhB (NUDIX family)
MWTGAAAVCINKRFELLMVLQGKPEEEKRWSVPSGGRNPNESYEECCKREVFEETGYIVDIKDKLFVKGGAVHYFKAVIVGGEPVIQDPDGLIYEIGWKSIDEIMALQLCFEEDRNFLIEYIRTRQEDKRLRN